MKHKIVFITLLSIVATFFGCDDDFLEVENPNALNADNFWLSQADAEAGIYAVYSSLQFAGVMGANATVNYALRSEAGKVGNVNRGATRVQVDDALVDATNGDVQRQWDDTYQVIFRANQVLENVPDIDMDETAKREILGEARFMRGLAFFWLATTFNEGNIVLPIVAATNLEESRAELSDRETVYAQIFEDLTIAQENLEGRLNWDAEGLQGRATWGAVTSILGKVHLYEENFVEARREFKKVIDSGEYSLAPNIVDNFTEEGEFNPESIFEVQFFVNLVNDGNFGNGEGENPNESTLRPVLYARGNGGFGFMFTTHFISGLYRNEVVNPNLPINIVNPQIIYEDGYEFGGDDEGENEPFIEVLPIRRASLRSQASIVYQDDGQLFYQTSTREAYIPLNSRAYIKKFMNTDDPSEARNSGINERVIRYADVMLMYAEAVLRDTGDIAEALPYINQVRERSGLVTLETLFAGVDVPPIIKNTFPDITDAESDAIITQLATDNPQFLIPPQDLNATNILRHLFNKERPAEFAWEGRAITWNDLRRRPASIGTAIDRIQELGDYTYGVVSVNVEPFELNDDAIETALGDFVNRKNNFNQDDFFYPIPASEILLNPSLGGN
ncbi:RagB/SusD family nutrient uptake outer membrane protein [uncultured Aquimarina sp.]|uniref:RagB/SusD family nutrient uptake outer membrane protein n=1 Tax=uncultured Aquimarina sp. TaxID=575652 RepID=UPI00262EE0CB|nr:RagB/SusD family nutrient uptake outer membrane protein [uncultured Aquimarina sp.]